VESPAVTQPFLIFMAMMGLLLALFLAVAIPGLLWAIKRSGPYTAEEAAQAETEAQAFLSSAVPTLLPWGPGSLADVADRWQGTRPSWRTGKIDSERGTIGSVSQPEGPAHLAFAISRKGVRGFVRLCTCQHELRLEVLGRSVNVTCRGVPLGAATGGGLVKITYMDASRQVIGFYDRRFFSESGDPYGHIVVRDHVLGQLKKIVIDAWGFRHPPGPILRNVAPHLTQDEEDWLLAGIATELLLDLVDSRLSS
jgi:hypothetical protein